MGLQGWGAPGFKGYGTETGCIMNAVITGVAETVDVSLGNKECGLDKK